MSKILFRDWIKKWAVAFQLLLFAPYSQFEESFMSLQDSIALFYYGMLVNCLIFFGGLIYEKYNKPAEHVPENYLKFEDPEVVEAIYNFKPSRIQAPDIVLKLQIAITTGLF